MVKTQFKGPKRQRGITMLGVFIVMAIGLFLGLFALKIIPEYLEHWTVAQIAEDTRAQPEILAQKKAKIYDHLNRAYRQNNLWDLKAEDTVVLERQGRSKSYSLNVKYEKRIPFFHNIHLITAFDTTEDELPVAE